MVMPSVTTLRMDSRMAGLAQRNKVALVMCAALGQRFLVMHLLHGTQQSLLVALLTERVLLRIAVTNSFPRPAVPTAYSRVTVVLLVAAVLLFLMLLTEPSVCQLRTAGKGTGPLWFSWHLLHLLHV